MKSFIDVLYMRIQITPHSANKILNIVKKTTPFHFVFNLKNNLTFGFTYFISA